MAVKLAYQSPKWEKEQKKELQLFRQSKGLDITLINLQRILKEEEEYDATQPYAVLMSEAQRLTIQAMAEKDEKRLTDQLIQRVKAYRKQPVGYSTFVDAYSIAYIKLARLNNMSCDLDIVEIPKMFFDDAVCQIDAQKVKLPFLTMQ